MRDIAKISLYMKPIYVFVIFIGIFLLTGCNEKAVHLNEGEFNREVQIHDTIELGSLQTKDLNNGGNRITIPIKWKVLELDNGKALVIADEVLFYIPYSSSEDLSWKNSTARNFLNENIDTWFNENEESFIVDYEYEPDSDGVYLCDKLFILDYKEFDKYITDNHIKKARWSMNAKNNYNDTLYRTNYQNTNNSYRDSYVLRYSREQGETIYYIKGSILNDGFVSEIDRGICVGIRPSMWIRLE